MVGIDRTGRAPYRPHKTNDEPKGSLPAAKKPSPPVNATATYHYQPPPEKNGLTKLGASVLWQPGYCNPRNMSCPMDDVYEGWILQLAQQGGELTSDRLEILKRFLVLASRRIEDVNSNFLALSLAIMLVESTFNQEAINSKTGALGLMQLLPRTIVDILTRLINPARQGDKALYDFFDLHLTPRLRSALQKIRDINSEIIPRERANRAALVADRQKRFRQAIAEASALVAQGSVNGQLALNPEFNIGLGVFLLAKKCEDFKEELAGPQITDQTLRKALAAYSGSSTQAYSDKVIATFHLIKKHPGIIPFIIEGRLGINNAIRIMRERPDLLPQIINGKITPDQALNQVIKARK